MPKLTPIMGIMMLSIVVGCSNSPSYSAKIVDFGIYAGGLTEIASDAPRTTTGRITQHRDSILWEETTRVPARLGTIFGFKYILEGGFREQPLPLRYVWTTPGITPPGKKAQFQEEFEWGCTPGSQGGHLLRFEEQWELVPGAWTLSVLHGDRVLAQKAFTVYLPEE